jgi:diguanylate cyclase (GGDEF)-like protein
MSYKILIIEDSASIINTLKNFIQNELNDVQIFVAKSMKESATLLLEQKGKFDIVLADLGLPDAPNGEVVEFIAKFSIPIVILTGTNNDDIEAKFRNKNIVDYVIKDGISALSYASSIVKRILNNSKIKVLVVDDSKTFLEQIKALLRRYRFQALTALNGEEALKLLEENRDIKIVLTDYLMPKINGLELTKRIRKEFTKDEISIIIVSNDLSRKIPAKFLKYGANDFIYKGFSNEEFFARINSNIEILELFDELKNKANKDYLTGMYNRRYLFDSGKKLYEEYKNKSKSFAVALIDIDKFKNINDTYGHNMGDIAIKEVAIILNKYVDKDALISRMGGEEFCMFIYDKKEEEVKKLLEQIRVGFEKNEIQVGDLKLEFTVSIGCSLEYGESLDEMIQKADIGLYDAKNSGRNKVRYR